MPENVKTPDNLNMNQGEKKAKELVFEHLKQGIREVMETDKFKDWCNSSGKLYMNSYSFNNAVLVFLNDPKNTYTMGYEAWKDFGRQVEGGAKSIQILAPVFAKETEKNGLYKSIKEALTKQLHDNPNIDYASHKLGQSKLGFTMLHNGIIGLTKSGQEAKRFTSDEEMKKFLYRDVLGKVPVYFNVVNVFDVSKTIQPEFLWLKNGFTDKERALDDNGDPVKNKKGETKIINTPEHQAKFVPYIDLAIKENDFNKMDTLFSVLQKVSGDKGIPMTVETIKDKDMLGYYERPKEGEQGKGKIVIGDHISPTQRVSVAFHEMTHGDLHGNLRKLQELLGVRADANLREVQAEAAAYITAKNFGIETDTKSFNYLAAWSKGKDLKDLEISLELIYRESKSLMTDIQKELEARGLTLVLEPEKCEPLKEDEKNAILKSYAEYIVNKADEYINIGTDVEKDLNIVTNADEKDIVQTQYNQIISINSNLMKINELHNELEKSTDGTEQRGLINKIDALQNRIAQTETDFNKLTEMRIELVKSNGQPTLKQQFSKNPASVVEQLQNAYPEQFPALSPDAMKYIASSKYVNNELSVLLNNDSLQFLEKVIERLAAIENVKSDNGTFIEVVNCEQWGDEPIFDNGTLVHPKLADKIVAEAEMQTRMFKEMADRSGDYYPSSKTDLIVYSLNTTGELTAFNTKLEIGDGTQENLMEHMAEVLNWGKEKGAVLASLNEAVKEPVYKDKIYSPAITDAAGDKSIADYVTAASNDREQNDNNRHTTGTQPMAEWKREMASSKAGQENNNGRDEKENHKVNAVNKENRGD